MDQRTENLFEIQDAIAKEVANALKASLAEGATSKLKTPWNEEALKLYQKGRLFYDRSDEGDLEKARDYFKQSYALDSSQAITLSYLAATSGNLQQDDLEAYYTMKAITVDSTMPEVRASASMHYFKRRNFRKAFYEMEEGLKTGNSIPLVLRSSAFFSYLTGSPKQGVILARRAIDADPLIGKSYRSLNQALWTAGDYPELLKAATKGAELFPRNEYLRSWRCQALIVNGKFAEALKEARTINNNSELLTLLYFQQKNKPKLDSILGEFNLGKAEDIPKARYFMIKGEADKALDVLGKHKIGIADISDIFELCGPYYASLKDDERFQAILRKYTYTEKTFSID